LYFVTQILPIGINTRQTTAREIWIQKDAKANFQILDSSKYLQEFSHNSTPPQIARPSSINPLLHTTSIIFVDT